MAKGKAPVRRGTTRVAKTLQRTASPMRRGGQLKVSQAKPGRLTAPTAYKSNPSGGLRVSANPVGNGTYNPQGYQPSIQASYTSSPRGR